MHPPLVLFDDGHGRFGPLTDLRAAFELRTGAVTTAERVVAAFGEVAAVWVPERLAAVVRERTGALVNEIPPGEVVRCVNGRLPLPGIAGALDRVECLLEPDTAHVVSAVLPHDAATALLRDGRLEEWVPRRASDPGVLLARPWHLLDHLSETLEHDLESASGASSGPPPGHVHVIGSHPVLVDPTAQLLPGVVIDAGAGPVAVGPRVTVRPHAVLCGPCSIGADSVVGDHALIKARTACGPACRLSGEIGGTIIQGHSNKGHDGHLGDSLLGEWVNLGAGTTNSNLLNTYGTVPMRLEADGPRERSGRIFLGAVIGDHVKTAIGTRLMTGTVLGTGSMIATTAPPPATVDRFAWRTDEGDRRYRIEKFLEVARTVMARRCVEPGPAYLDALQRLHDGGSNHEGRP